MDRIDKVMPYVFPLILAGLLVVYYLVDPMQMKVALPCPWRLLTHTQCPACGFQRALHAVMHGEFLKALRYNYFFVLSIPYAGMAILATWYNVGHVFDGLRKVVYHRYVLKGYIWAYFAWWILRNVMGV